MRDSVLIKIFTPAMATPISKKGECGTTWFISSDNKTHIIIYIYYWRHCKKALYKQIFYFGKIYYVKVERLYYFS